MDKWTVDNWLTLSGVVITAFFSYFLWRATVRSTKAAESSAAAAEASTRIAISIEEERKKTSAAFRFQLVNEVHRQADDMLTFLVAIMNGTLSPEKMKSIPRFHTIPSYQIAEYFTEDERKMINSAWDDFDQYVKDFWTSFDLEVGRYNLSMDENKQKAALMDVQRKFLDLANNLR